MTTYPAFSKQVTEILDHWSACRGLAWVAALGLGVLLYVCFAAALTRAQKTPDVSYSEKSIFDEKPAKTSPSQDVTTWLLGSLLGTILVRGAIHFLYMIRVKSGVYSELYEVVTQNDIFWCALKQEDPTAAGRVISLMGPETEWRRL